MTRAGRKWTPDDDRRLLELRAAGTPLALIAKELDRTQAAVDGRIQTIKNITGGCVNASYVAPWRRAGAKGVCFSSGSTLLPMPPSVHQAKWNSMAAAVAKKNEFQSFVPLSEPRLSFRYFAVRIWAVALLVLATAGCGSVRQQSDAPTPVGESLTADVGGVVFRAEGSETIQYGGMQGDKVVLLKSTPKPDITARGPTTATNAKVPIIVDWRTSPRVSAAGKIIFIEAATPSALWYKVER
jgi:hypothetical protein